jgi:hypothetical protein
VADRRFDFLLLLGVVEVLPPLVVLLPLRTGSLLLLRSFAEPEADESEVFWRGDDTWRCCAVDEDEERDEDLEISDGERTRSCCADVLVTSSVERLDSAPVVRVEFSEI